jgi:hypothetical protein
MRSASDLLFTQLATKQGQEPFTGTRQCNTEQGVLRHFRRNTDSQAKIVLGSSTRIADKSMVARLSLGIAEEGAQNARYGWAAGQPNWVSRAYRSSPSACIPITASGYAQ